MTGDLSANAALGDAVPDIAGEVSVSVPPLDAAEGLEYSPCGGGKVDESVMADETVEGVPYRLRERKEPGR
jgi:predicted component of type VI protein secretion system